MRGGWLLNRACIGPVLLYGKTTSRPTTRSASGTFSVVSRAQAGLPINDSRYINPGQTYEEGNTRKETELDVLRPNGSGLTRCDLEAARSAERELPPFAVANLGVAPFQQHGEIVLTNHGEVNATVLVNTPQSGTPMVFNLVPGGRAVIAPYSGPEVEYWNCSIENPNQTESVVLGLSESFSWSLSGLSGGTTPSFTASIRHDDEMLEQAIHVNVIGTDTVAGRTVHVSLHDPGVVVEAPGDGPPTEAGGMLRLLPAYPNPFASTTHIGFDLPRGGDVRLELFDPSGRRVRVFERTRMSAGRTGFEWDGKSANGHDVAPGIFFYRLRSDGEVAATGHVIRVR